MSKVCKRGTNALLLLSYTSVLSSFIEVPLIYAAENDSVEVMMQVKEESVNEEVKVKFVAVEEEGRETTTETQLLEQLLTEKNVWGTTYSLAIIDVTYEDDSTITLHADEAGQFLIENWMVQIGENIQLQVSKKDGELLEELTFEVQESVALTPEDLSIEEEVTEEPVEEAVEPVESEEEEVNEVEEPVEEVGEPVAPVEEKASEPIQPAPQMRTFSTMAIQSTPVEKKANTYHYIKSGDTLQSIAKVFSVSVQDLMRWNDIKDVNKIKSGEIIAVNGMNDLKNYNKETTSFATNQQFMEYVAKYAKTIAADYDIYASIMNAQAMLESGYGKSDLASKANNLFGIKSFKDSEGYKLNIGTWEELSGKIVHIEDYFKIYPSYYDSFIDNAKTMREGLTWDKNFYNGTWVENTNNFKDATLFLTGRYATDTRYYFNLNDIILRNNLTRFDEKVHTDTSYDALVTEGNYIIRNMPRDHVAPNNDWYSNIKQIGNTNTYLGNFVMVSQVTRDGQYANIYVNGYEAGWVHTDALTTINLDIENVNREAYISTENGNINSLPLGQPGTKVLSKTGNYQNRKVQVTSQTLDGLQSYITLDGVGLGWVMSSELSYATQPYSVVVQNRNYSIDSLPWGTTGFQSIGRAGDHAGKELQVVAKSHNGAYHLISYQGKAIGWVDYRALTPFNYKSINEKYYITSTNYSIDSLPWGTPNFKKIGNTAKMNGQLVTATKESANGAYWLILLNGKELGWIDKRALGLHGQPRTTMVHQSGYSIDSLPWGTTGFKKVASTTDLVGKTIQIAGSTQNGAYLLIRQNGADLGWVDARAVLPVSVVAKDYSVYIGGSSYSIDSMPWGTPGFKKVGVTSEILGQYAHVTAESANGAYAFVHVNGKPIGWVDKRSFGLTGKPYTAVVSRPGHSIDTLPWGSTGFRTVGKTSDYLSSSVRVLGSIHNGAYLLIAKNGVNIGWVDARAAQKVNTVDVNYSTTITRSNYSIDSLPWGVTGFKQVDATSAYVGKTVQVTEESQNRAYALISFNGKELGWVDKRAFQ
ncbi:GW dipeptide domain-containing protein [Jeotgalibaca porci]|uniref:GW dipeptide domain-containing protein n=1 Tax=Jeotgalibaca porci TaxID=1868793 RepID=UPI003F90B841